MNKTQRDQNEALIGITIRMGKEIEALEKMIQNQGPRAGGHGGDFIQAVQALIDAKELIEHHTNNIRKATKTANAHYVAGVD